MRGKRFLCAALICLTLFSPCAGAQAAGYRTLKQGCEGADVKAFKTAMYWLGYFSNKNVSEQYNGTTVERVKMLQRNNGLEETGEADAALQELVFSGACVPGNMGPTPIPMPPRTEEGFLADASAGEEFIYQDEENGLWIYLNAGISIEIRRCSSQKPRVVWYEADIHCSPESPLTSYVNGNRTPGTDMIPPVAFARQNRIVLGISDDHFGYRINTDDKGIPAGIIIREGKIIWEKTRNKESLPNLDILAVFEDGSMKTFGPMEHTAQEYLDMGVKSTYAFGPALIKNGELSEYMTRKEFYSFNEPRMALGMIAPYHYAVIMVEGRMEDRSVGVHMNWVAERMLQMGVTEALNLDGGGTAILIFMGKRINKTSQGIRNLGSMTGFGVSNQVPQE